MERFKKITIIFLLAAGLFSVAPLSTSKAESFDAKSLKGKAEDLWGNKIELSNYRDSITLIHPFSPANCGYCLVDGEFVRENYFKNNEETGGYNFLQCLFNPQLDIYTYTKHYRETTVPVLTFPLALNEYHRGGFPFMIAFRDGRLIYNGLLSPYEETFQSVHLQLWPQKNISLVPTSPIHMATRFIKENRSQLDVKVFSDRDQRKLTNEDYKKNLFIKGTTEEFDFKFLKDEDVPITIKGEVIQIGYYKFPKSDVGLNACFPNPLNKERYLVLELQGSNLKTSTFEEWVDYTIFKDGSNGKPEILLHGLFEKDKGSWKFSSELAFGTATGKALCKKGVCPIPSEASSRLKTKEHDIYISSWDTTSNGEIRTLGTSSCRFPSMTIDKNGVCWVAWEENGDILLASLNGPEPQITVSVENDSSDSFNPIIASDGSVLCVFYLNDRDNLYGLYGRYFDGSRLSEPILITEREPFDVITPAVAVNQKGKMVVAWSEWKAHERYLRYRVIENRILGQIQYAAIKKPSIDYVNAWYPSLIMDSKGQPWGAWNQHYPGMLSVCAGDLAQEATLVTKLPDEQSFKENGGYPSIVIDKLGRKWVFWESIGWNVLLAGQKQKILASYYDEKNQQWCSPYTLTLEEQTALNQTPKAAIDNNGVIWVVFSGRKNENDIAQPWGIYIAQFSDNKWSIPKLISGEDINGRAPDIRIGKDGKIWISWHSGAGKGMRVKVLSYTPQSEDIEYLPSRKSGKILTDSGMQTNLTEQPKYRQMSHKQAAQAFLQACADRDWVEFLKFWAFSGIDQRLKDYFGGLEVISLGEPVRSPNPDTRFVPYKIKFASGKIVEGRLSILKNKNTGRFYFGGGL